MGARKSFSRNRKRLQVIKHKKRNFNIALFFGFFTGYISLLMSSQSGRHQMDSFRSRLEAAPTDSSSNCGSGFQPREIDHVEWLLLFLVSVKKNPSGLKTDHDLVPLLQVAPDVLGKRHALNDQQQDRRRRELLQDWGPHDFLSCGLPGLRQFRAYPKRCQAPLCEAPHGPSRKRCLTPFRIGLRETPPSRRRRLLARRPARADRLRGYLLLRDRLPG